MVQTPLWQDPVNTTAAFEDGSTDLCWHRSSTLTQRHANTQMHCHTQSLTEPLLALQAVVSGRLL